MQAFRYDSLFNLFNIFQGYIDGANYIPEFRFKVITVTIVICALTIGILIPSIELVIGLVGSTIGVAICIMFPASCYIKVNKKDTNGKLLAQVRFNSMH